MANKEINTINSQQVFNHNHPKRFKDIRNIQLLCINFQVFLRFFFAYSTQRSWLFVGFFRRFWSDFESKFKFFSFEKRFKSKFSWKSAKIVGLNVSKVLDQEFILSISIKVQKKLISRRFRNKNYQTQRYLHLIYTLGFRQSFFWFPP